MSITLSPRAEKQLRKLSKVNQIIIAQKIRTLASGQSSGKKESLRGYKQIFRVRVGDYRIVYRETSGKIYIILIGHRREIYKLVDRLLR